MDASAESVACLPGSENLHGLTVSNAPVNLNVEITSKDAASLDVISDENLLVNFTAEDMMIDFSSPLPDPTSNFDDLQSISSDVLDEATMVVTTTPVDQSTCDTEVAAELPPSSTPITNSAIKRINGENSSPITNSAIKRLNGEQIVKARESAKQDKSSAKSSKLASIQDEEEENEEEEEDEVNEGKTETEIVEVERDSELRVLATGTADGVTSAAAKGEECSTSDTEIVNNIVDISFVPLEAPTDESQLPVDSANDSSANDASSLPAEEIVEPLLGEAVAGSDSSVANSVSSVVHDTSQPETIGGDAGEETDPANIQRPDVPGIEYLSDDGAPRSSQASLSDTDADTNRATSVSNSRSASSLDLEVDTAGGDGSNEALVEARPSSPYFVLPEGGVPDFSEGLNMNLDIDDEIARAMEGLERLSGRDDDDASSGFSLSF